MELRRALQLPKVFANNNLFYKASNSHPVTAHMNYIAISFQIRSEEKKLLESVITIDDFDFLAN